MAPPNTARRARFNLTLPAPMLGGGAICQNHPGKELWEENPLRNFARAALADFRHHRRRTSWRQREHTGCARIQTAVVGGRHLD